MLGFIIFRSFMKHYQLRLVSIAELGLTCMFLMRVVPAAVSIVESNAFDGCIV
jgi:hypothetical protein